LHFNLVSPSSWIERPEFNELMDRAYGPPMDLVYHIHEPIPQNFL
jgi:hypothetical protein